MIGALRFLIIVCCPIVSVLPIVLFALWINYGHIENERNLINSSCLVNSYSVQSVSCGRFDRSGSCFKTQWSVRYPVGNVSDRIESLVLLRGVYSSYSDAVKTGRTYQVCDNYSFAMLFS